MSERRELIEKYLVSIKKASQWLLEQQMEDGSIKWFEHGALKCQPK